MERPDFDRVMDCAAEVFAVHGFTGIGMRELSEKCQVSAATLYYYFGSKDKLFEAVCHAKYRKAIDFISGAVDFNGDFSDQLARLCGQLFDLLTGDQTLFLLLRRDLIHGSIASAEFRSRHQYEGMIEILRRLLSQRYADADAQRLAFTSAALIFGYCEFAHVSRGAPQAPALSEHRLNLIAALTRMATPQTPAP